MGSAISPRGSSRPKGSRGAGDKRLYTPNWTWEREAPLLARFNGIRALRGEAEAGRARGQLHEETMGPRSLPVCLKR